CRAGKLREQLVTMDAEDFFEEDAVQPNTIGEVRNTQARAGQNAGTIGIAEDTIAQAKPVAPRSLRGIPLCQTRKVQFELVSVTLGVWALDFAQLALEAGVHDAGGIRRGQLSNIAVVLFVK